VRASVYFHISRTLPAPNLTEYRLEEVEEIQNSTHEQVWVERFVRTLDRKRHDYHIWPKSLWSILIGWLLNTPPHSLSAGGWITGHSYVTYGPLLNGASQVVFEGVPSYPDGEDAEEEGWLGRFFPAESVVEFTVIF